MTLSKGRVERLFGVLQDRLIKEMRLKGIKTKEEANDFLEKYLPQYNKRFSICPANDTDIHVELPKHFNLDRVLSIKTGRTVRNDNTIAHNGRLYQIEDKAKAKKVTVEERLDGSLHITSNGEGLRYKEIDERPRKANSQVQEILRPRVPHIPAKDHPWRRWQNSNSIPRRSNAYQYGS